MNGDLLWYDQIANLDLFWPGGPRLHGLSAEVHASGQSVSLPGEDPHCEMTADGATWYVDAPGLRIAWRWQMVSLGGPYVPADGWDVWLEVTNTGRRALRMEHLDPLNVLSCDLRTPVSPVFYQHGWNSWTPTFVRQRGGAHYVDPGTEDYQHMHQPHHRAGQADDFVSEWVTVLKSEAASLLLGFVTAAEQLASIQYEEPNLVARCWLDGTLLEPGATIASERLWLRAGYDPLALLHGWAARTGQRMGARLGSVPPTGWCSWYQFFGTDTASDVEANLAFIARNALPLDTILIDDGYQTAVGDWLDVNEKYSQGLKALAQRIRAAGRTPGIWTAPFGAAGASKLFQAHPDWFLRGDDGKPVVAWRHQLTTDCYALDPTHPGAAAWLADTFGKLREWGFGLFKIDFIFAAALAGRRFDPSTTRAGSLRRGIEIIRQAIGDDAFLLGCGAPQAVCVGVVDGMRVGPDVAPYWSPPWIDLSMPAQVNALRNSIARAPFHNQLWVNDPDCVMVRAQDSTLTLDEMRSQVALAALLGGLTLDSDDLTRVSRGRLKYLRQALPPTGVSALPLDLFDNELPGTLLLSVDRGWGRWWVVGLTNWEERSVTSPIHLAELGLPPDRYHVYHYWRRRYLGVVTDQITVRRHRAHETLVLLIKPATDQPDFLTSTFHVCQGAVEVRNVERELRGDKVSLRVTLQKAGRQFGQVLFSVPPGWQPTAASVNGRQRGWRDIAPGAIGMGFTLVESAQAHVEFERLSGEL